MIETLAKRVGPLDGVQVVVTRPEGLDGPLTRRLVERGATVLHWPVVRFEPPEDAAPLDAALGRLESYDGVVFTSPRAVEAVSRRVRQPAGRPWVAAIGEATRKALDEAGWRVDIVPRQARSEALVGELAELDCAGIKVLFPASSIAREDLSRGLRQLGAAVERVTAYRTVPNEALDGGACLATLDADRHLRQSLGCQRSGFGARRSVLRAPAGELPGGGDRPDHRGRARGEGRPPGRRRNGGHDGRTGRRCSPGGGP
jgi:uroporphyrinogen III methyltransferase/synthase